MAAKRPPNNVSLVAREGLEYHILRSQALPQTPKINHFYTPKARCRYSAVTQYLLYFSHVFVLHRVPKYRYFSTQIAYKSTQTTNIAAKQHQGYQYGSQAAPRLADI